MSFVPNPSRGTRMNTEARTLIFWVLMISLAVVLWQMAAGRGSRGGPAEALSYSDFMKQVDSSNVESAHFELSQNTANVTGSLKQPAGRYRTTVPRESAANVMNTLRSNGVDVAVVEAPTALDTIKTIGPIVVLVILLIFVMRQKMRTRQNTGSPGQPSPGALG